MNKRIVDNEFAGILAAAKAETQGLDKRAAYIQKENHYLRRINRVKPHVRIAQRAFAAAFDMASLHLAGYTTGLENCVAAGMPERTFYPARALCQVARIHNGKEFTTDDPDLIEQRLSDALAWVTRYPDALIAKMPRSKRPKL